MADIQFNESDMGRPAAYQKTSFSLSALVMKTGLAKDEAGAQKMLAIALVLIVLATILVFWTGNPIGNHSSPPPFSPSLTH